MEHKVLIAVGVSVLLVVLTKLKSFAAKPKLNLPPGPWTLPFVGSVHHLVTNRSVHNTLQGLAAKYGPLMQLWFGEVPTVVATSAEAAQAILKTHDLIFADRHVSPTGEAAFKGNDILFSSYGDRWRELRKICIIEMLSSARVRSFRPIREEEVAHLVQSLSASAAAGSAVNLSDRIMKCTNDIVVRGSVGSRCKSSDTVEYLHALRTLVGQITSLNVADLFPSSKLMQVLSTAPRKALAYRKKIERILERIIDERKKSMQYASNGDGEPAAGNVEDFLDVLLRLQKEGGTAIPITDETITLLLFDMFGAGSETSSMTLIWIMAELIRSPRVMAKAQAEVRQAFKGKSTISEEDIAGLSYLNLVIKESLRLHCPAPMLVARACRETCQVMGYDIPKGTSVMVNVWAICRDPKYWEDADEFRPERFENSNLDYKGNNFKFLPFGSGRRMCAGVNLGLANMELTLASLLYHFDWKLPDGMEHKDVDMREAQGILASKRTSIHLYPVTRIAPSIA